jgi:phosphoribosylglycinamide formyltransferase-1
MLKVGILISGGGTTAEAIIKSTQAGILKDLVEPAIVISSSSKAEGITKAQAFGVPVEIIERKNFPTDEAFGEKIIEVISQHEVQLVSQNGWLPLTPKNVVEKFDSKIINQHPGPLDPGRPDFGGKGMFGARVVCARLLYCFFTNEPYPWTESTIHHVTEEFDKGEIIRVVELPFAAPDRKIAPENVEGSTPVQEYILHATKQLQEELLEIEHENVIQTLASFAHGEEPSFVREQPLVTDTEALTKAKRLATTLFPEG